MYIAESLQFWHLICVACYTVSPAFCMGTRGITVYRPLHVGSIFMAISQLECSLFLMQIDVVAPTVSDLVAGHITWTHVEQQFPVFTAQESTPRS